MSGTSSRQCSEDEKIPRALKEIKVSYNEIPSLTTFEEALEQDAPLLHENIQRGKIPQYGRGASYIIHDRSNICHHFRYERGDIESGFTVSDRNL